MCVTSIPVWSKIINSYILKHHHNNTIYDNGKILASVKKSKCEFKQLLFVINCSLEWQNIGKLKAHSVSSRYPPYKDGNDRFTTVPLNPLSER